jgi:hypothetical protein
MDADYEVLVDSIVFAWFHVSPTEANRLLVEYPGDEIDRMALTAAVVWKLLGREVPAKEIHTHIPGPIGID